ncbi:MAG: cupin domain-containing protein [Phycisphaeraceae bacterium]|nr:cupin domain-containing protein [Phycisphaeraceae bacterium]
MSLATPLVIDDLLGRIEPPADGTLSVTLQQSEYVKVVLFGFAAGQELSEHTASVPAIMHQLSGNARWRLGEQELDARPGAWVSMPAGQPHALIAQTPCVMLLTMFRNAADAPTSKTTCDS